jgi:hypothetical protein
MDHYGPSVVWQPTARYDDNGPYNRYAPLPISEEIKFQAKPNAPEISFFSSLLSSMPAV